MAAFSSAWLPHLGAALVLAMLVTSVARLRIDQPVVLRVLAAAVFILALIPLTEFSVTHYARILTGDLAITTLLWFSFRLFQLLFTPEAEPGSTVLGMAMVVVLSALLLYPTALGLTYFDLYAHGYYPVVLAPVVFTLFAVAVWFGFGMPALLLAAGFVAFALGLLESDNLWDYLLDPVLVIYSLVLVIANRDRLPRPVLNQQSVEAAAIIFIAVFLAFAVFLAKINPDAFRYDFTIEDGFIEWCTVVTLVTAMVVCGLRFRRLRGRRPTLFLSVTGLLMLFCLFGAGEEISWGQRIFGLETPDYLKEMNAQGEIGLHNLVIEVNGEKVKLNKLIFGTGLAVALLIYLGVVTPLYRTRLPVRRFFNAIAAPMPRNYQIVGYLAIVATVELLVDSSKRGEMTEFAGSIMFALNVIYPYNAEIFDPAKTLGETG